MDRTTENIRPSTSRVMYTPRTPRMRERERFDLSIRLRQDQDDEISGLEGMTILILTV